MNQWDRLERLIGTEKLERLKNSAILVLGLGGVGSAAVEHLVRNGIGTLILVDYDSIDITNLNRQIMTSHSNLGQNKIDALIKRVKDINPNIDIIPIQKRITKENLEIFWQYSMDYIIDANDTIEVKKELIRQSILKGVPFITCMGTGNKWDPMKLEIKDIRKTSYDPIAKTLRKMVREEKIKEKIPVIVSEEIPLKKDKIVASASFVPNTAGMLAAHYVITELLKDR